MENLTTGVNTGFAVLESNQTSMQYNLTNWTQTCANSDRMRIADMNNDSHDDVVTFSNGSSMMCIHYYNTTTMTYDPYFNLNTSNNPLDVQIADIDGDGYPDFVTIHGSTNQGVVSVSLFYPFTNSARPDSDIVIYRWNDMVNRTDLVTLRIDDFFNNNQTTIIVSDAWNDATEIVYDSQSRRLTENPQKFRNISSDSIAGDIDGDGDIDFITPNKSVQSSFLTINHHGTRFPCQIRL
jgi:hypothetical protein